MNIHAISDFVRQRRAAIAITMAIALLPLVLLIGIAIDVTFVSQARTQAAFASEAAASSAVRLAAATYALEVSQGTDPTTAAQQAINSGNIVGNLWFNADLGSYLRGKISTGPTTNTLYTGKADGTINTAVPPNFTATVTSTTKYPPIFNLLFGQSQPWVYGNNATAATQFAYGQILMMLDTSNSMLIGATDADVQKMEDSTVCIPPNLYNANTFELGGLQFVPNDSNPNDGTFYEFAPGDGTWIDFTQLAPFGYSTASATGVEPPSYDPSGGSGAYQLNGKCTNGGQVTQSCALACHDTTQTMPGGFSADLYGYARSLGVQLRVDVLLSATENAISDIKSSEYVSNQISVGVYQFNSDVKPIIRGGTGDPLPEATSNMATALGAVQNDDYNINKSEQAIPALINGGYNLNTDPEQETVGAGGNTNLRLSLQNLVAGTLPTVPGTAHALTSSGNGNTLATPVKFMFIITDGMEDEYGPNNATDLLFNLNYNLRGDMTSLNDGTDPSGTCYAIKQLGYTVYVLYVDYLPVSEVNYYNFRKPSGTTLVNAQTYADFPNLDANGLTAHDIADAAPYVNENKTPAQITQDIEDNVPTAKALAACASSPSDFYSANSASDIQTALSAMLKKALATPVRLTN